MNWVTSCCERLMQDGFIAWMPARVWLKGSGNSGSTVLFDIRLGKPPVVSLRFHGASQSGINMMFWVLQTTSSSADSPSSPSVCASPILLCFLSSGLLWMWTWPWKFTRFYFQWFTFCVLPSSWRFCSCILTGSRGSCWLHPWWRGNAVC